MNTLDSIVLISMVFMVAGWVKGVVGMGLPVVIMGVLSLMMPSAQAAALLIAPSLVSNLWQIAIGSTWAQLSLICRRLALMLVFICLGVGLGIPFLTATQTQWPGAVLGGVLALYALIALCLPKLTVPEHLEKHLSPVVGLSTGVLAGATGIFVVPAVPYMSSLGFSKDELIQALGLSFCVSTMVLAIALAYSGNFPSQLMLASSLAIIPALLGMALGQWTRHYINPESFRRWFLIAVLLLGCTMLARGLS